MKRLWYEQMGLNESVCHCFLMWIIRVWMCKCVHESVSNLCKIFYIWFVSFSETRFSEILFLWMKTKHMQKHATLERKHSRQVISCSWKHKKGNIKKERERERSRTWWGWCMKSSLTLKKNRTYIENRHVRGGFLFLAIMLFLYKDRRLTSVEAYIFILGLWACTVPVWLLALTPGCFDELQHRIWRQNSLVLKTWCTVSDLNRPLHYCTYYYHLIILLIIFIIHVISSL